LQSELTQNYVKTVERERQIQRALLDPSYWCALARHATRDSQHPRVEVEACHLSFNEGVGLAVGRLARSPRSVT
jgi:hypothetical protein